MAVFYLKPGFRDYIWGGHRLVDEYHKEYEGERLAESWELSCHPTAPSRIGNGPDAGMTLQEYIDREGPAVLGLNCVKFGGLPILIKFIDAKEDLSIQVHPDNVYARAREHQEGKTEMWVVMAAEPGAFLYYGFSREVSREELKARIAARTLTEVLNKEPVHPGDVFFVESGTIHAIGRGTLVAEIQQNSDVTYRVYDYGRKGADGKERELHVEKALEVLNCAAVTKKSFSPHLGACEYFTVDKLYLDGQALGKLSGTVSDDSFLSLLVLEGEGILRVGQEEYPFRKGDSLFLTAGTGAFQIEGKCEGLLTGV